MRMRRAAPLPLVLALALGGLFAGNGLAAKAHPPVPGSPPESQPPPGGGAAAPSARAASAAEVRAEILFAWQAYERYAWGHDEVRPLTKTARDWYGVPLLMTPVDSLDTLLLVGLKEEAAKAQALIVEKLSFDQDLSVQNFEITIRLLGGLLSGYQATGDPRLLRLADDLGHRLLPVFDSPTGMPYRFVNLRTGKTEGKVSNPAEIGTLLLEWGTLSKLTGKPIYYDKAKRALVELYERRSKRGLVGEEIDVETGAWVSRASHVGGGIDSYYEYLLKAARLFGDRDCERMWKESRRALHRDLADEVRGELWYGVADMETGRRTASEYGALHAFLPAVLALDGDLRRARRLQESNDRMWRLHRVEPDGLDYRTMKVTAPTYPLRPEIVESVFTLHQLTGDPRFSAMGARYFADLKSCCRTDAGYTVLKDVTTKERGDLQPSYFLAETLKYLYLLFAPEKSVDLKTVVFNTEAHALRKTW